MAKRTYWYQKFSDLEATVESPDYHFYANSQCQETREMKLHLAYNDANGKVRFFPFVKINAF